MGARGPIGKRSEERMGHRSKEEKDTVTKAPSGAPVDVPDLPDADPLWHPIASDWYLSLRESGQAAFYQPSDWAVARYAADLMSKVLLSERGPNGQLVAALNSVMSSLLTTEGDRRRARMELERKPASPKLASVSPLDSYRDLAGG
ncbi:phage terminase small subunit [Streptomyces sp. B21-083]|uniref:phage terminase small subunit n=1 Tax=Streptomyces sp. B21-083 TaxID=3039410 RepID=UPI002FF2665B